MESVGSQKKLSFERAFQIAVQGIRIRFGRSLITVSGVVLGIAFLMSNVTAQFIKKSVASERELRQTVELMQSMIKSQIGDLAGKKIAVKTFGKRSKIDDALLASLAGKTNLAGDVKDADLMLVLGDQKQVPQTLNDLSEGMKARLILDSLDSRTFGQPAAALTNYLNFFGAQHQQDVQMLEERAKQESFRVRWIVIVSLLVTVIGVSNALLMSVTERFREIGTMKCLGALSSFIRQLFLIESSLIGLAGSIAGCILGIVLSIVMYGITYSFGLVLTSLPWGLVGLSGLAAIFAGTILSILAAIYPARFASRMVPASALRSTV